MSRKRKLIRMFFGVGIFVFALGFGGSAGTQAWMLLTPTGGPPAGNATTLAGFDPNADRMIVFGGAVNNTNEIWVLANADGLGGTSQWIKLTPLPDPVNGFPAARSGNSLVYDSNSNRIIIFGGCLGNCLPIVNDTWVLTNANGLGGSPAWIKLSPAGSLPAPRSSASAVYDPVSNTMIVFGGNNGCCFPPVTFGEVWLLRNANALGGAPAWTQLSPTGGPPAGQASATAVYDPASNRMTVFGGFPLFSAVPRNAVWVLSDANGLGGTPVWTNLIPEGAAGSPPARVDHTAVYDPIANQMIIFGGRIPGVTLYNDTWMLTNANGMGTPAWTQLFPMCGSPAARLAHVAVLNVASSRMTIFGGETDSGILTDTWVLNTAQSGACTPPPSGACILRPSGMIGWWAGDGNANDISGSGQNGNLAGGVTFSPGKVGLAFDFNGIDGRVEIADSPVLHFGTGDLTVDAWIKAPPRATFRSIVGKEQQSFPFPSIVLRLTDGGLLQFAVTDCGTGACGFSGPGEGGSREPVQSPFRVDDGVFHHVAGVRHSSGYELYVDGQLVATRLEPARNADNGVPLFIGIQAISVNGSPFFQFNGIVDEVEIFDRALTPAEIQAIFNAGSAGKCKNRPPVAICTDVTVAAGPSCSANASIDNGSFDPDTGDTIGLSQSPSGPYPLGSTPVTLTVTDNHGASSQCTATVTVVDITPPVITAPPPVTVYTGPAATGCGTVIPDSTLGTATASDNCSGPVTISRAGVPPGNFFPVGTTTITYTATDSSANKASAPQAVIVIDNTPPTISGVSASPAVLWPPNHKMVDVIVNYNVGGNCDPASLISCDLTVSSNEPPAGTGDGHTSADWQAIDAHHVQLRAERSGSGNGRVYTITITCTDTKGNFSTQKVTVQVPHDQGS